MPRLTRRIQTWDVLAVQKTKSTSERSLFLSANAIR